MLGNNPTVKDETYIKDLFKKYLNGQCNPEEIDELFGLISNNNYEPIFDKLISEEIKAEVSEPLKSEQEDRAIGKVKSVLLNDISSQVPKVKKANSPYKIANSWLKIAAMWLIVASGTTYLLVRYFSDPYEAQIKQHTQQLTTLNGQRKLIQLFDGTKIWLSPSSVLRYEDQLINNYREVWLDGEAFFEVAKDKSHPFIIHSGRMQTEVVGTSFNVKSFAKQSIYSVTVVTGIVKVSMLSAKQEKLSEVVLKPKQQAVMNNSQASLVNKSVPTVEPELKKREGILSYDGASVPEVVADFKRYYSTVIELQNKSATCLCYGEFDTNKPISITLSQLAAAIGAAVRQTDKGYIIEGGCNER